MNGYLKLARLISVGLICTSGSVFAIHPANEFAPSHLEPSHSAVITNGLIKLGVKDEGHLNMSAAGIPSKYNGTTAVGLRLIYPDGSESEATAPGCLCEGWGASADGVSGYANVDVDFGANNLTLVSFNATADTANSVVEVDSGGGAVLEVTHDFHPSTDTANLYEVVVTLKNVSGVDITDLRYRRTMDWDIGPTTFFEMVTIDSGTATDLVMVTNNGFDTSNPLSVPNLAGGYYTTGDRVDDGPDDHGAFFHFEFQDVNAVTPLADGESKVFKIFYGAAFNEPDANAALAAVGAEAYSFGQPYNLSPDHGEPNTFIFAFAGVGGDPVFGLNKVLLDGPDNDADGELDKVILVGQESSTDYEWKIDYSNPDGPPVVVIDSAPAESVVNAINGDGTGLPLDCGADVAFSDDSGETTVYRGGKANKNCRSDTWLDWMPETNAEMLTVSVNTRQSPGKGHKVPIYAPTSCGALYLNAGAAAYELDPATGEPLTDAGTGEMLPPLLESNALCIAAVMDVGDDGSVDFTGNGDEDGDSLSDYAEACDMGTDPCDPDSDGDGVNDNLDDCPLEGDAGYGVDALGCPNPAPVDP
jgi:hypothetical protein